MKMIKSVNLTEEQIAMMEELCSMENRSASAIVGIAIEYYYKSKKVNE
jgi:hypothetical protein